MVFDNLMALHISIRKQCPPEVAFKCLDKYAALKEFKMPRFDWTERDIRDALKFKEEGLTWSEIGSYYGMTASGVCHAVKTRRRNFID